MSRAAAHLWLHRCSRGDPPAPGSPCAALMWQAAEITRLAAECDRLRAIERRAREVPAWGDFHAARAARYILGEDTR